MFADMDENHSYFIDDNIANLPTSTTTTTTTTLSPGVTTTTSPGVTTDDFIESNIMRCKKLQFTLFFFAEIRRQGDVYNVC